MMNRHDMIQMPEPHWNSGAIRRCSNLTASEAEQCDHIMPSYHQSPVSSMLRITGKGHSETGTGNPSEYIIIQPPPTCTATAGIINQSGPLLSAFHFLVCKQSSETLLTATHTYMHIQPPTQCTRHTHPMPAPWECSMGLRDKTIQSHFSPPVVFSSQAQRLPHSQGAEAVLGEPGAKQATRPSIQWPALVKSYQPALLMQICYLDTIRQ